MVRIVVSESLRAFANDVNAAAESPMPWRRRRTLGVGDDDVVDGGEVIVKVMFGGKSLDVGLFVGILNGRSVPMFIP